jgi:predicted transcriptional regulator
MQKQVLQPQEVEVFYIIPAIRAQLAKAMKESGKSQKEIATLLGLRESTVSQYINDKRATLAFDAGIKEKVSKIASSIGKQVDAIRAVQILLREIKKTRAICDIHRQFSSNIPGNCGVCFEVK